MMTLVAMATGCASKQATFKTPEAAVDSLISALRTEDTKQLEKIFGPDSGDVLSSGDPVNDRLDAKNFLTMYDQKHALAATPAGDITLIVGPKDWPFPVPIIHDDNKYLFDTAAGADELLNRRIGRNELSTEQVCLAIVDAQRDYVAMRPMGGDLPEYARKVMSDPGQKNGLYWTTKEGEPQSPLGPFVAEAAEEGYKPRAAGQPSPPYHGYHYRLLTAQGPHAQGGAADYVVNGKLIGGFGLIAYPAQYGNSGITTFITNHDGVVYQRDLGTDTEEAARSITTFDPGPGWTRVTDASIPPDSN
jgi:hypothetical protein